MLRLVSTKRRGWHDTRRRRSLLVVAAYILIQTEVGKATQVAKEIAEIKGVQQAEDVTGPYDVIVR
jgi:DNA-binding Lrp family transcriptional regulator